MNSRIRTSRVSNRTSQTALREDLVRLARLGLYQPSFLGKNAASPRS